MILKRAFFILFIIQMSTALAQEPLDKLLSKYNSHSIPYISVEELKMQVENGKVLILDSREKEEFEVSHLKNALFVGYNNFEIENITPSITEKERLIVVYCSLGIRSENISEKMKTAGYTNVKNLYGGIFEWKNKGYPVFDIYGKETQNVHAFSKQWSKYLSHGNKIY